MQAVAPSSIQCAPGVEGLESAHAGCFVVRNGKLLAERSAGLNLYDLPGGQTDWIEAPHCTALRETYTRTGYVVEPRELLAVVRDGFSTSSGASSSRSRPGRGENSSRAGWLDADEVAAMVRRGGWRFEEASSYLDWLERA